MKYYLAVLLLFTIPIFESSIQFILPNFLKGIWLFPALAITMFFYAARGRVFFTVLLAAVWRDVVLLMPLASTLVGTTLAAATFVVIRRLLTNHSFIIDVLMFLFVYIIYALGGVMSFILARRLGLFGSSDDIFNSVQLISSFILALTVNIVWRRNITGQWFSG